MSFFGSPVVVLPAATTLSGRPAALGQQQRGHVAEAELVLARQHRRDDGRAALRLHQRELDAAAGEEALLLAEVDRRDVDDRDDADRDLRSRRGLAATGPGRRRRRRRRGRRRRRRRRPAGRGARRAAGRGAGRRTGSSRRSVCAGERSVGIVNVRLCSGHVNGAARPCCDSFRRAAACAGSNGRGRCGGADRAGRRCRQQRGRRAGRALRAVARARAGGAARLLRRAALADAVGRRPPHRPDPRRRPALPAHPRRPRLRRAPTAGSFSLRPRVLELGYAYLSGLTLPDLAAAAPGAAVAGGVGERVGRGARRRRRRLRRAGAHQADHDGGDQRGDAVPGVRDQPRPGAAGRAAAARARRVPRPRAAGAADPAHAHRPLGAARGAGPGAPHAGGAPWTRSSRRG